jgi:hypothetical protein
MGSGGSMVAKLKLDQMGFRGSMVEKLKLFRIDGITNWVLGKVWLQS